jgi:hypothetical protein
MSIHPLNPVTGPSGRMWDAIHDARRTSNTHMRAKAYQPQRAFVTSDDGVSGIDGTRQHIVSVEVEIPDTEARVLFWASGRLLAGVGTALTLEFNDTLSDAAVRDFPNGVFPLATFTGIEGFTGPAYVAPALDRIAIPSGPVTLPNGLETGSVSAGDGTPGSGYFPTLIMPYSDDPPTPGTHTYSIAAYRSAGSGGAGLNFVKMWLMVL